MQKIGKKASILIWSIFLSLVISFSFIFISTNIAKTIKNNSFLWEFIDKKNSILNIINTTWTWLLNDDELILENSNYYTLKLWEEKIFTFNWNTNFSWNLRIVKWGPIYYELKSLSWVLVYSSILSWILSEADIKSFTWYLGWNYNNASFYLKNLWWLANIFFYSDLYNWNEKKYKVIKNIWWNLVEEKIITR